MRVRTPNGQPVPARAERRIVVLVSGTGSNLAALLAAHDDGVACVVAPPHASPPSPPSAISDSRVRFVSPELVKGLEFDLVVLLAPSTWGEGTRAAVDRYVAMTRATDQLMILD